MVAEPHTCPSLSGSDPLIRPFVLLIAVLAMLLAVAPGSHAYAADMGLGTAISSSHGDPDGCASAMTLQGQSQKHDAGGCAKMNCCLGAMCVFAGLPSTAVVATAPAAVVLTLLSATAALNGRDVAPPLDPPRSFA